MRTVVWQPIPGYEGLYAASTEGQLKSVARKGTYGRLLRTYPDRNGYQLVQLCKDGSRKSYLAHRLVALSFLGYCPEGLEVNHKDGVKTNNQPDNLEYVDHTENIRHSVRIGLK